MARAYRIQGLNVNPFPAKTPTHIEAARAVQDKVVRPRPLCAYPGVAKYEGSGSIDDAANFSCGKQ